MLTTGSHHGEWISSPLATFKTYTNKTIPLGPVIAREAGPFWQLVVTKTPRVLAHRHYTSQKCTHMGRLVLHTSPIPSLSLAAH